MLRITVYAGACIVVIAMLVHLIHHRRPPEVSTDNDSVAVIPSTTPDQPQAVVGTHTNENEILASCHPHLGPTPGPVPNIDVSEKPNPAAIHLKVRFWVNGDGFVTQAFLTGANAYTAEDQEDALHYTKRLTFAVPNTAECRVRQMELIGNFVEMRGLTGEWATVLELHPRYSFEGAHVVQRR